MSQNNRTIHVSSQNDRSKSKKPENQSNNNKNNNNTTNTNSGSANTNRFNAEELAQVAGSILHLDQSREPVKQETQVTNIFNYLKLSFLSTRERQDQFMVLLNSSLKTALFMMLEWIPFLVQLYHIGKIDDQEKTGGFGMGLVWSNCFAVGLFGGLGVGVETLASFAYGAQKYKMTGVIFQRGFAIATTAMIPIILLMWMSDDIITFVSGKASLGRYAADYCRWGIPAFYFSGIYNIFKGFLTAQNEYSLPLITVTITAISSFFWNWLFITEFDLCIKGAAIARIITEAMNLSIVYYLVCKNRINERCSIQLTKLAFQEWGSFLKFAIPIGSLLTLEWFSYELFTLQASNLPDDQFGAHVIMNNINTVYYQFGYGVSIAITTYVGNEMGNKCIEKALDFSKQGIMIICTFLILTQLPFTMMKDSYVTWFSVDIPTQISLGESFTLFQICMILDAILAGVTGVTRGIGKQNFAAASFVVSYLVIGQIIAYFLGFTFNMGITGIWIGVMFGMIVTTGAQIWCITQSDWNHLLQIIQANIERDEKRNMELMMLEEANAEPLLPIKGEDISQAELEALAAKTVEIEMKEIKHTSS
ncbi:MATE efflux family protein (macronuclear) [Tetrahymena thermophila SB210]|uniref:MATE efflux family protein n=1 Tax=Tetrahymena thermophila (strain SB210) TaxID=312017 RepID=Q22LP8_TETTS|nr:MATE efflux family protein [Tetrahymena thermophila SB210]EAR86218.1 MATE efflux family protein [Tetrahymena thermophila SB210]|eukprot:XP_976813.1 MATE efflux family protein [Tetrahymena thermophila SB210]